MALLMKNGTYNTLVFSADNVVACVHVLLCLGLSKSLSMLMTQRFYINSSAAENSRFNHINTHFQAHPILP